MNLTAVVTAHNYAHYLPLCIDSALKYCDEVLVYDDGSTDDSLDVLAGYGDSITVVHRDDASGTPVWGSNLGIEQATSTHLIFLDADNYLVSAPPIRDVDYTFASIQVVDGESAPKKLWNFTGWPLTADECWRHFVGNAKRGSYVMPFPWGGVWRVDFLTGKQWREFETRGIADDYRTALDWCKYRPTMDFSPTPFLAFRQHSGQMSRPDDVVRKAAQRAEAARAASEECMPPLPRDPNTPPDVVYLCRTGENPELAYSLRSLKNVPHSAVWIFGGAPKTAVNVNVVPTPQKGDRWCITTRSLVAACNHPGVSDPFILMNDDFYIMEPVDEIPELTLGAVAKVAAGYEVRGNGGSRYFTDMQETFAMLRKMGIRNPVSFDAHAPMVIHKQWMLDAIDICNAAGLRGAHKRTVYGNLLGITGEQIDDVKVYNATCEIPTGPWLSSSDEMFTRVIPLLRERFPDPGPYESPPLAKRNIYRSINGRRTLVARRGMPIPDEC